MAKGKMDKRAKSIKKDIGIAVDNVKKGANKAVEYIKDKTND